MGIIPPRITPVETLAAMRPAERYRTLADELARAAGYMGGSRLLLNAAEEFTKLAAHCD